MWNSLHTRGKTDKNDMQCSSTCANLFPSSPEKVPLTFNKSILLTTHSAAFDVRPKIALKKDTKYIETTQRQCKITFI